MRCPRCHLETADPAPAFCPGCGAPLRLPDEPRARPLDVPLAIDRRTDRAEPLPPLPRVPSGGRAPPIAAGPSRVTRPGAGASSGVAEVDASHWELGRALDAVREPAPARVAPAGPAPATRAPPGPSPVEPRRTAAPRVGAPASAVPAKAAPAAAEGALPPAAASAASAAPLDDALPEPEVDALEIRLARPDTWRRAAAAAVDVGPFVAAGVALVSSLLSGGGPAVRGLDGLLDLVARERVIVLSVAAALTLAVAVYATLAHALAGATLGKRLLGLAVVGPDGRRPSLGRSAARAGLAILSAALLGLGLLLALFTRSGRALHDFAARTWVVDARGRPAGPGASSPPRVS